MLFSTERQLLHNVESVHFPVDCREKESSEEGERSRKEKLWGREGNLRMTHSNSFTLCLYSF